MDTTPSLGDGVEAHHEQLDTHRSVYVGDVHGSRATLEARPQLRSFVCR